MELPVYLTFDCYGTLVDFDLGSAALEILAGRLDGIDTPRFLREFEQIRFEEVLGEYRPYRDVLRESLERAMTRFGMAYQPGDGDALVAAVPAFGPFPDVPPVLEHLRQYCKLAIISNTDDDLIVHNVRNIGVPFEHVVTAEQARAYKPALEAFEYMLGVLGCREDELVHVAQGFNYDIMPAAKLGWKRVWINRRGQQGDPAFGPYDELPDLTGLPGLLGLPSA